MRRTLNDSFNKIANTEKASRKKNGSLALYYITSLFYRKSTINWDLQLFIN